jgi:DNA-binding CsgD family transcriptional regulator
MANAVSKISLEELFDEENQVTYPENSVEIIYNAMDELNVRDKKILELYLNGNSHAEIGAILNISEDYSKTRLYLIRTMLAKKVEPLLNIKIKTYGNTDQITAINRNVNKKSYYFRKKTKEKDYGKSINVREKEEEVNGRIECGASPCESSQCA